jgi:hypothetical protein
MTHQMTCLSCEGDRSEWFCPECGRHFVLTGGDKRVIAHGDPAATHTGGTGGVTIGAVEVIEPRLEPFEAWAKGFGWGEDAS